MNEETTVYTCPNCGGGMLFDIGTQEIMCPYCDTIDEIPQENNYSIESMEVKYDSLDTKK